MHASGCAAHTLRRCVKQRSGAVCNMGLKHVWCAVWYLVQCMAWCGASIREPANKARTLAPKDRTAMPHQSTRRNRPVSSRSRAEADQTQIARIGSDRAPCFSPPANLICSSSALVYVRICTYTHACTSMHACTLVPGGPSSQSLQYQASAGQSPQAAESCFEPSHRAFGPHALLRMAMH